MPLSDSGHSIFLGFILTAREIMASFALYLISIYNYRRSSKNSKLPLKAHSSDPDFPRPWVCFFMGVFNRTVDTNWCLWALVSKLHSLNVFRCDQYFFESLQI